MAQRWQAFGWDVHEVDGHDPQAMAALMARLPRGRAAPHVLIARTTFGKGVSYMENQIRWHYLPMSEEQYAQARAEVEAAQ
jgi:transketolase